MCSNVVSRNAELSIPIPLSRCMESSCTQTRQFRQSWTTLIILGRKKPLLMKKQFGELERNLGFNYVPTEDEGVTTTSKRANWSSCLEQEWGVAMSKLRMTVWAFERPEVYSDTDQKAPPGSLSHVNSGNVSLLQQAAVWYFRNFRKDSGNIGSQAEAAVSWGITPARWWLQTCFIITTTCLNDPIWLIVFISKRLKPSSGFTVSQLFQWRYPHCMQTRGQKRKNCFIHVRYRVINASKIHTLDTWGMQWLHVTWSAFRMHDTKRQLRLPSKNMKTATF